MLFLIYAIIAAILFGIIAEVSDEGGAAAGVALTRPVSLPVIALVFVGVLLARIGKKLYEEYKNG